MSTTIESTTFEITRHEQFFDGPDQSPTLFKDADGYLKPIPRLLIGLGVLAAIWYFYSHSSKKSLIGNLQGGQSEGMSIEDIAELHGVDVHHIEEQLAIGISIELEHTDDPAEARVIAMDHLVEDPNYYTKLEASGL